MTTRAIAVTSVLALVGSAHAAVPLLHADSKEAIESEYLVVFNENATCALALLSYCSPSGSDSNSCRCSV